MLIQGTRDWKNISVTADVSSDLCATTGIAVRVQGLKRYYALLLQRGGEVRIIKVVGDEIVLASESYDWHYGETYDLNLTVNGNALTASINGETVATATDDELTCGSMAFVIEEGCSMTNEISVAPS